MFTKLGCHFALFSSNFLVCLPLSLDHSRSLVDLSNCQNWERRSRCRTILTNSKMYSDSAKSNTTSRSLWTSTVLPVHKPLPQAHINQLFLVTSLVNESLRVQSQSQSYQQTKCIQRIRLRICTSHVHIKKPQMGPNNISSSNLGLSWILREFWTFLRAAAKFARACYSRLTGHGCHIWVYVAYQLMHLVQRLSTFAFSLFSDELKGL